MADKEIRWEENAPGKYYVDETCIAAKFCVGAAPASFKMEDSGRHAFVYRQPETEEEEAQAREALRGCPVMAIGEDNG